jgi:hypothetical protein
MIVLNDIYWVGFVVTLNAMLWADPKANETLIGWGVAFLAALFWPVVFCLAAFETLHEWRMK